MKAVAGTLRLDLAQYRELAAFAQFGSDLDEMTRRTLARGERLVEILKQGQYEPVHVGIQVAVIWAATKGYIDKYPVSALREWEHGFATHLNARCKPLLEKIDQRAKLKDIEADLKAAIEEFEKGFNVNA
jgi:F-type H+-transporting ATPase subunit alpha